MSHSTITRLRSVICVLAGAAAGLQIHAAPVPEPTPLPGVGAASTEQETIAPSSSQQPPPSTPEPASVDGYAAPEFRGDPAMGQPRRVIHLVLSQWLTNCYILVGRTNKAIVIDPTDWMESLPDNHWGLTGRDTNTLVNVLRGRHLEPRYIISTHGHLDHVSGDTVMKKVFPQCQICMNAGDVDKDGRPKDSHMFPGGLPHVDRLLRDGETLECDGIKLKVIHTPGHSPGSICLLCGNWLFSGDTLFYHSVGRTNFNDSSGDWPLEIQSIRKKLYSLPLATLVLPGHAQFSTIGEEKAHNPWTQP